MSKFVFEEVFKMYKHIFGGLLKNRLTNISSNDAYIIYYTIWYSCIERIFKFLFIYIILKLLLVDQS